MPLYLCNSRALCQVFICLIISAQDMLPYLLWIRPENFLGFYTNLLPLLCRSKQIIQEKMKNNVLILERSSSCGICNSITDRHQLVSPSFFQEGRTEVGYWTDLAVQKNPFGLKSASIFLSLAHNVLPGFSDPSRRKESYQGVCTRKKQACI